MFCQCCLLLLGWCLKKSFGNVGASIMLGCMQAYTLLKAYLLLYPDDNRRRRPCVAMTPCITLSKQQAMEFPQVLAILLYLWVHFMQQSQLAVLIVFIANHDLQSSPCILYHTHGCIWTYYMGPFYATVATDILIVFIANQ